MLYVDSYLLQFVKDCEVNLAGDDPDYKFSICSKRCMISFSLLGSCFRNAPLCCSGASGVQK